ncbi:MAG: hypothetical protein ACREVY_16955 [Gammaproteobacteria bacterium]
MRQLLDPLKNTLLHPQWLSLRFHRVWRRCLVELDNCTVLDIGSGDSDHTSSLRPYCRLYRLDYPATNRPYQHAPDIYGDAASLPRVAQAFLTIGENRHYDGAVHPLNEAQPFV